MSETKQTYKNEWIITTPDNGAHSEEGMLIAIQKVAEKTGVKYTYLEQTRDTGFGQEKLYQLEGHESDISDFLADIYDWAPDMTDWDEGETKMNEIINRNKNIIDIINEIETIEKRFDLTLEKSTTTESIQQKFRDAYNSRNDSDETEEFFSIVEELYELAGYHHIGSGILHTHYYTTEEWDAYRDVVMPIIESYIENNLWDDVCNSTWLENERETHE